MLTSDDIARISEISEDEEPAPETIEKKSALDYFSLALTTCAVGYIPLAPGTFGSAVGVLIYLLCGFIEAKANFYFLQNNWLDAQMTACIHAVNLILFLLFCFLAVWASGRAAKLFQTKDPQKVVVDEVIGQLTVFMFVPFGVSWKLVLAGFVLFRLFDIWKPYPINFLENLPTGIGVCADDILAGVYGGICLAVIHAAVISL